MSKKRDAIPNTFCTIITQNHIDKAATMLQSMQSHGQATLHVLIINYHDELSKKVSAIPELKGMVLHNIDALMSSEVGLLTRIIVSRYKGQDDEMRWALKSAFVQYLTKTLKLSFPICYCDCDLYFYDNYQFLIDKLCGGTAILLTPHYREIRPMGGDEYRYQYKHGLYNAGFVGLGDGCQNMLEWWAEMCAIECTKSVEAWTYVDQRYLDVVPIYFDNVEILRHYGCNVAGWNMRHLSRTIEGGKVKVGGSEIIFIHFSQITLHNITTGKDPLLYEHYTKYQTALQHTRRLLVKHNARNCISGTVDGQLM